MIKALLLDLDGVITDSSQAHFEAWKQTALPFGIELPEAFEPTLRGISRTDSLEAILKFGNLSLTDAQKETFMKTKNDLYLSLIKSYSRDHLLDGVLELLELGKQSGLKIALVSASKNAETLLNALDIKGYFDYIVDPSKHPSKPAPDMFIDALNYFRIMPNEALAFEDAKAGIQAIQTARIHPIGIGQFKGIPAYGSVKEALPNIIKKIKEAT